MSLPTPVPSLSQPSRPRSRTALILFLDFDGTLTTHDTLAALTAVPTVLSAYKSPLPSSFPRAESAEDLIGATSAPAKGGGAGNAGFANGGLGDGGLRDGTLVGVVDGGREKGDRKGYTVKEQEEDAGANGKTKADFTLLTSQYLAALRNHKESYSPKENERTTIEQELAYLESLRPIEEASILRVEASALFAGLTRDILWQAAVSAIKGPSNPSTPSQTPQIPRVGIREGAKRCVEQVLARGEMRRVGSGPQREHVGAEVRIVSVNWSRIWIKALLAVAWTDGDEGGFMPRRVRDRIIKRIVANELHWDEEGRSTGRLERWWEDWGLQRWNENVGGGIWTAGDKARVVRKVLQSKRGRVRSVFVGDSVTDLGALVEVNVGICLRVSDGGAGREMSGSQRELEATLERCGVLCEGIREWRKHRMQGEGVKRLWWARGFEEIYESGVLSEEWGGDVNGECAGERNGYVEKMMAG
ncbi:hypothetical protein MMC30_004675 [Trapelia coarctata]|nr:hypothetical protein [Trapelia coarctata]